MDITVIYPLLKSLWTVWFCLLFAGIVAYAVWPKHRARFERYSRIPFDDRT